MSMLYTVFNTFLYRAIHSALDAQIYMPQINYLQTVLALLSEFSEFFIGGDPSRKM